MESQNKYIGDESFKKFLGHYGCPTPLPVVKMKFAGAVCSPNLDLRPADVISSFWPAGQAPRLETKNEADLFFKFFMGLWDEVFQKVRENKIKLEPVKLSGREQIRDLRRPLCRGRGRLRRRFLGRPRGLQTAGLYCPDDRLPDRIVRRLQYVGKKT